MLIYSVFRLLSSLAPSIPSSRGKTVACLIVIVVVGFLAYSNTFDDDANIVDNHLIRDPSNVLTFFSGLKGPFASRPLMHATFAANYYLDELNTAGYHAVNIAIHLLNGMLLFLLVSMTGKHLRYDDRQVTAVAMLSAIIFILHPAQTEAVTNAVNRSMLFATAFYFSGLILFLKAVTAEKRRGLYLAGLFATSFLGMASRENFATFPAVVILYDICFISGLRLRKLARNYLAYAPVVLSLGYMAHLALNNTYGKSSIPGGIPPYEYALTEFRVHWTYIRLLLFPVNQTLDYDYPVPKTIFEFGTLAAVAGYISLWITGLLLVRKRPVVSFLTLFFLVILLPISFGVTFLDLRLDDVIFEHRLYLPGTGLLVLGALALYGIATRACLRWPNAGRAFAAILVIGIVLLASGTYARNNAWRSEISLWQDVVRKSPNKARAHNNLGLAYYQSIQADKAIAEYETAIRLDPNYHLAYNNLGVIHGARGQTDKRIEAYRKAVGIDPSFTQAHVNLGSAYLAKGQVEKAIYHLETALKQQPANAKAHSLISQAYGRKGIMELAERHRRMAERGR